MRCDHNEYFKARFEGQQCSFCGSSSPSAEWHGHTQAFCCAQCAMTVLPAFMADAMAKLDSGYINTVGFKVALANFWKALYLAVSRKGSKNGNSD